MKSVVVKSRKINSVRGNIKYLQDKKEHPDICYTNSTCDKKLWYEYAKVSQQRFKASGQNNGEKKCVEAREFIFVFPREFYQFKLDVLIVLTNIFMEKMKKFFGCEIMIALHGDDKDAKNLHLHVMVMEREKIVKKEKIATRRLYFDDQGKQVHSRKYALDENGKLKPGYSFVKKGEKYGEASWTGKKKWIRSNETTETLKKDWAKYINHLQEKIKMQAEPVVVYDRKTSPYLPLQSEPRPLRYSNPEKQQEAHLKAQKLAEPIKKSNAIRMQYNSYVDEALLIGFSEKELLARRKKVSKEIQTAVREKRVDDINSILTDAVEAFEKEFERLRTPENDFKTDLGNTTKSIMDLINAAEKQKQKPQKTTKTQKSRGDER